MSHFFWESNGITNDVSFSILNLYLLSFTSILQKSVFCWSKKSLLFWLRAHILSRYGIFYLFLIWGWSVSTLKHFTFIGWKESEIFPAQTVWFILASERLVEKYIFFPIVDTMLQIMRVSMFVGKLRPKVVEIWWKFMIRIKKLS